MVRILDFTTVAQFQSLVRRPRSHERDGAAKRKKKFRKDKFIEKKSKFVTARVWDGNRD